MECPGAISAALLPPLCGAVAWLRSEAATWARVLTHTIGGEQLSLTGALE